MGNNTDGPWYYEAIIQEADEKTTDQEDSKGGYHCWVRAENPCGCVIMSSIGSFPVEGEINKWSCRKCGYVFSR